MIFLQEAAVYHASQWLSLVDNDRDWLTQWMPHLKAIQTTKQAEAYVRRNQHRNFYTGTKIYEIWEETTLIGLLTLHSGHFANRSVDIGYWLGRQYTRRGWTAAACQFIFSKVFVSTAIEQIYIRCEADNKASQAVALKLGMQYEKTLKNIHSYRMGKADWLAMGYEEEDLLRFLDWFKTLNYNNKNGK